MLDYLKSFVEHKRRPFLLKTRSSRFVILTAINFAVFTDIFLYAFIVPVVPFSLRERSNVPPNKVSDYVSALIGVYGGSLALTSPIFGWLADQTRSRRFPFLAGLVILAAATVMLHLGRTLAVLITARVLQGASASVVWIVGLALLADTVPTEEIGVAVGYVYLSMSLGILLGPLIGGVVFEKAGYDAVFAIAYALVGFDIVLRLFAIEKAVAQPWLDLDEGANERQIELVERSREEREAEAEIMREEVQTNGKIAPSIVTLLKSRRLIIALWGSMVVAILMTSLDAILPIYVQEIFDWTSLGAGLLFLAIVIPSFLGPIVGRASDKFGPKWIATTGLVLAIPVEVLLRLVKHNTLSQKVLLVALLALLGLCTDFVITPIMAEITTVVERKSRQGHFGSKGAYAQGYGLFNFAFAIGCLIGPFWSGFVKTAAGWGTVGWSLALLCGISAVPTAIWCGGSVRAKKED